MLIDANALPHEANLEADVCIVGAGPAGLTLAHRLQRAGVQVCLLESGGLDAEPEAQALSGGAAIGDWIEPLEETRVRRVGGTAQNWRVRLGFRRPGAYFAPLGQADLEPRAWLPDSGWPIEYGALEPYYRRAQRLCGLGPFAYDATAWASPGTPPFPLRGGRLRSAVLQVGDRTVFTRRLRDALIAAPRVTVATHATALQLDTAASGAAVTSVAAISGSGRRLQVKARRFVLALGGIENARLLLLSHQQRPCGLGNEYDLVGRFLMDHPQFSAGTFVPSDRGLVRRAGLYDLAIVNGGMVRGYLAPSDAALRELEIPNFALFLYPRPGRQEAEAAAALWALATRPGAALSTDGRRLLRATLRGRSCLATALLRALLRPQPLLPDHSWGGWSRGPLAARGFVAFEAAIAVEQAPSARNRVTLDGARDRLGQPRVRVEWWWSEEDRAALRRALDLVAREFARSGLGGFRIALPDEPPPLSHHHMGTTRMHASPRQGVVDGDGRVHGLANLYIAGSSVFPTGGYANPTLTIVALALRLADHLQAALRNEAPACVVERQPAAEPLAERLPA